MRLFIRYVLRSIRKSPIQPLLILLTLTLAVTTMVSSAKIIIQLNREQERDLSAEHNYDLNVSISNQSDVSILITEEIERVIGDAGKVLGEFHLKASAPELTLDGLFELCAVDFYKADQFYEFRFKEYSEIRETELNHSIIISSLAAEDFGLAIGDEITLRLLDTSFRFKVVAIAIPDGSLAGNHGIIDISAVINELKACNPAIAHIADDFHPANSIKIQLNDKDEAQKYRDLILSDDHLTHTVVDIDADGLARDGFESKIWLLLTALVIFIVILISVIVIATSQSLLAAERRTSTALFIISGADPWQLDLIAYIEAMIYAVISSALGLMLSIPVNGYLNTIFDWRYYEIAFETSDILLALLSAPLVSIISTFIHNKRTGESSVSELLSDGRERRIALGNVTSPVIWGALLLLGTVITIIVSPKTRYIPMLITLVCIVLFTYYAIPHAVHAICNFAASRMHRLRSIPSRLYLSLRAIGTSHPLIHSIRILSVLMSLLISITVLLFSGRHELELLDKVFDCDYVTVGVDEDEEWILEESDAAVETFRISLIGEVCTEEGDAMLGVSVEDDAYPYLNDALRPKAQVTPGEIAISQGLAAKYAKRVGDDFTVLYRSDEYVFTICEILDAGSNIAILDASSIGKNDDTICIRMRDGVTEEEISELASKLEVRGAYITTLDKMTGAAMSKISSFLSLILAVVIAALISTAVGIANLVSSVYRERGRERELYFTLGMTRSDVRLTTLTEAVVIVLISLLLIPIIAAASTLIMNTAANSFGFDMIY